MNPEFKIEVVEDGYILIKNEYTMKEQKKVYFSVKSLVEDLEMLLNKVDNLRKGKE